MIKTGKILAIVSLSACAPSCATLHTRSRSCRSVAAYALKCPATQVKAEVYSPSLGTSARASAPTSTCVATCEGNAVLCSERKGIWSCHPTVMPLDEG